MLTTNTDSIGGSLPAVLGGNSTDERGEHARLSAFIGAIAVADLVKSTLGPKGMVRKLTKNYFLKNFKFKKKFIPYSTYLSLKIILYLFY